MSDNLIHPNNEIALRTLPSVIKMESIIVINEQSTFSDSGHSQDPRSSVKIKMHEAEKGFRSLKFLQANSKYHPKPKLLPELRFYLRPIDKTNLKKGHKKILKMSLANAVDIAVMLFNRSYLEKLLVSIKSSKTKKVNNYSTHYCIAIFL